MEKVIEKQKKRQEKIQETEDTNGELVVINDDYNTFDKVIRVLKKFCGLDDETAQLCTLKIHVEGSCIVMRDKKSILYPICENIVESGLNAEVNDADEK
jgi:ATP-dependent Clp protease adaptor protein ClpS